MFYALVNYPLVDTVAINRLRRKYDPQVDLIAPHITIVFPVPESIGEKPLISHIEQILVGWKPFAISLEGVQPSADHYLFLLVQSGKAAVIRMHDDLYTGVLGAYRRDDLPYDPHLTLGSFTEGGPRCAQALEEAQQASLRYQGLVDRLQLVKIDTDRSRIIWSKEFRL